MYRSPIIRYRNYRSTVFTNTVLEPFCSIAEASVVRRLVQIANSLAFYEKGNRITGFSTKAKLDDVKHERCLGQ